MTEVTPKPAIEIRIRYGRIIYSLLMTLLLSFVFFYMAPTGAALYVLIAFALFGVGFNFWYFQTSMLANVFILLLLLGIIGDPYIYPHYYWYRYYILAPGWPVLFLLVFLLAAKPQQD